MIDTNHILSSLKSTLELAIKQSEHNKAKADFESKEYWQSDGEITALYLSLSLIETTLKLIK